MTLLNMERNKKEMLEKLYEVEGLLVLSIERPEKSTELMALMAEKLKCLLAETQNSLKISEPQTEREVNPEKREGATILPEESEIKEEIELPLYNLDDEELAEEFGDEIETGEGGYKPVFSLNDKFLFCREFFGGDAAAFKQAIDKAVSLGSTAEIEKYLTDTLHIKTDGGEGGRLLAILTGGGHA